MRNLRFLPFVVLAAVSCGACASGHADDAPGRAERATRTSAIEAPASAASSTALRAVDGLVATAKEALPVYAGVDAPTPASTLAAHTEFGSPTALRVLAWQGAGGEWLEVSLPVRPNGSRGFVRTADVALARVDRAVVVDLSARVLRVVDRAGTAVLETPVAVGSPENPTPTGDFFVTDVLDTGDDGSAYGQIAIGVSAHSPTLSEFGGGDGQIGIHGTNRPASIGQAVSHGCVRVPNDVAVRLASLLPLGAPVSIH
jgi:lipoprotein-anchoring transpeptidase ErfK/SrfK